jgi:hypothetical protein
MQKSIVVVVALSKVLYSLFLASILNLAGQLKEPKDKVGDYKNSTEVSTIIAIKIRHTSP